MDPGSDARLEPRYDAGWYLRELPDDWTVIADVPVADDGDSVDWLVIGSGGVFAVTGKDHRSSRVRVGSGRILVDGQSTDYLRRAKRNATWIHALLAEAVDRPFWSTAVIAIMSDALQVQAQPGSVRVADPPGLPAWICDQPPVFTSAEVERLVLTARTWVKVHG